MRRENLIPAPALHYGLRNPLGVELWAGPGMAITRYSTTRGGPVICFWVYDGPAQWALAMQAEVADWNEIVRAFHAGGDTLDWRDGIEECLTEGELKAFRAAVVSGVIKKELDE